jgi:capsular polysaccharide transport system permease protein
MYPLWIVPSEYIAYLEYNPVLHLIELFRESFFDYYPHIDGISAELPVWMTLCIGFVGLWFYAKRETLLRSST